MVGRPRSEINQIVSAEDWVQTLMAAAGEPDIASKLLGSALTLGNRNSRIMFAEELAPQS